MNPPETDDSIPESIELPAPTPWPMVTAFGLTLMFAGLITNLVVTLVGFVCVIFGAVGWFRDCHPHQQHVAVPVAPPEQRAAPIKVSPRTIQHLAAGRKRHRARIPVEVHPYSAGVAGGLAGAAAMAILAMLYGLVAQGSIWYPINLLAAAGVPSLASADVETLRQFSMIGLLVAIVAHGTVSILVGLLYTTILPMLPAKFEWFWGGIVIPLIWTGLLFPVLGIINPALAKLIDWPWFIVCQVGFGVVGGYIVFKSGKIETMQTWSVAEKMGVEAMEDEK